MFGLKKSINNSENNNLLSDSDPMNERSISLKYIFYDNNNFTSQFELYIQPNNFPDIKLLITIDSESNFTELKVKIKKGLQNFTQLKNLNGFGIENISKITNGQKVLLPLEGKINKHLFSGDIIYCDILSEEYWIQTYFKLQSYQYRQTFTMEYKLPKKIKFDNLKSILLKSGLDLFLKDIKNNLLDSSLNYYVKFAEFQIVKNRKSSNLNKEEYNIIDEKIIDAHSIIIATINFGIFEELIHKQLIAIKLKKKEKYYLRYNEYCNLLFDELLTLKKFKPELFTIKDIAKELLKSQYNDLNSNFLFYNLKSNETIDDYMHNILNINDENDDEEEDDFEQSTKVKSSSIISGLFSKKRKPANEKYKIFDQDKNIFYIKKSYNINMIVITPFLFTIMEKDNYNEKKKKKISDIKSDKTYRTYSYNDKNKRDNIAKNSDNLVMLGALSLDGDVNSFDDDESDNNNNINTFQNKEIKDNKLFESINKSLYNYNDPQNEYGKKSENLLMGNYETRSTKGLLQYLRLSASSCSSICSELNANFNQEMFLSLIKKKFINYVCKKRFEKSKMPECRDIESVENDSLFQLLKNKKEKLKEEKGPKIRSRGYILFLIIFFFYYLLSTAIFNLRCY